MTLSRLVVRSLCYYWRASVATALCFAIASTVITGSLVVGESVRSSLRERALSGLGKTVDEVVSSSFFCAELGRPLGAIPAIRLAGSASNEQDLYVPNVSILGERGVPPGQAFATKALLEDLHARVGDQLFLMAPKPERASSQTLFGQRELAGTTVEIPVTVARALRPGESLSGMGPIAYGGSSRVVIVDQVWLAERLGVPGKANTLLAEGSLSARDLIAAAHPEDLGFMVRKTTRHWRLQSKHLLLPEAVIRSAQVEFKQFSKTSVALATSIAIGKKSVPYSVVGWSESVPKLERDGIALNAWAAHDLNAKLGDPVRLETLRPNPDGTFSAVRFQLICRRILPMEGETADPTFTPEFEGVSESRKITDWKPPFPVDLHKITPRDEAYWDRYRAAPKAFVSEETIRKMWPKDGYITGLEIDAGSREAEQFVHKLRPEDGGLQIVHVRQQALASAEGASDFSSLLMGLGVFTVFSGLAMAASVFGLSVLQRAPQLKLLAALGFSLSFVKRYVISEYMILAGLGGLLGAVGGLGFASVSLALLRSFMPVQTGIREVGLDASWQPMLLGCISGLFVGFPSIPFALSRIPKTALRTKIQRRQRPISFGVSTLVLRSIAARKGRFLVSSGVLASATFTLLLVGSNVRSSDQIDPRERASGTGGFSLLATSSQPLGIDFGSSTGRANLGFSEADEVVFQGVQVVSCLRSSGDDASCLNLAKPVRPKILGAPTALLARNGFAVQPQSWSQLSAEQSSGVVPAFADAEVAEWTLGSGLGKIYSLSSYGIADKALRFDGLLPTSILASDLIVSESSLRELFPAVNAPSLFLIETPPGKERAVAETLRRNLGRAGLDVRDTRSILGDMLGVQNAYISVFLVFGLLGLAFGTIGSGFLVLRTALERRQEFATLLAIGFSHRQLRLLINSENALAVLLGIGLGCFGAALVLLSQHMAVGHNLPVVLGLLALIVAANWIVGSWVASRAVRSELVQALRSE